MKGLLLAGTAFLGLAASGSVARATLFDFTYTGSLVDFTVPTTDSYQILAFGAQGGNFLVNGNVFAAGGRGAEIGGDFRLTAGEVLQIAVGGAGKDQGQFAGGGAGGGGSFVVAGNAPLVIAGGGGGGGSSSFGDIRFPGGGGLTGPDGGSSSGTEGGVKGGTDGNGGGGGDRGFGCCGGGGGGGFFTAGGNAPFGSGFGGGGGAFPGLAGGNFGGGFGGGGGADFGGGGGGGYSGGGGAFFTPGSDGAGGGGGSFDAGTDQILAADFQTGNGEVVITELVPEPVSEPGTLALLGAGLVGFAVVRRRRRPD
jgi:hypothetical protein